MESVAIGFGILRPIFGPLMWIAVIRAAHRLTQPLLLPRAERRRGRPMPPGSGALIPAALAAVAAAASCMPGRLALEDLCAEEATPRFVLRGAAPQWAHDPAAPRDERRPPAASAGM